MLNHTKHKTHIREILMVKYKGNLFLPDKPCA